MQRGTFTRFCVLACLAAVLCPLPAAAYCAGPQCQTPVGLSNQCGVGKMGGIKYNVDSRFKGGDFKESCLVNAGVACDHADNAGKQVTPASSCCSCGLYAKYCNGKSGFVTNVPHNPSNSDHSLLMPASPCTGVENWNKHGCPGESIWDEGEKLLSGANKDALWGMAINPVSRRGQHQMHVHLAPVTSSLMTAIVNGFKSQAKLFYLQCSLSSSHKHLKTCSFSATKCQDCPEVHIKHQHTNPSGAHPFETAYGTSPSNADSNTLDASTLVLRLPKKVAADTWAVVVNPYGPAECFFDRKQGSDLETACPQ